MINMPLNHIDEEAHTLRVVSGGHIEKYIKKIPVIRQSISIDFSDLIYSVLSSHMFES